LRREKKIAAGQAGQAAFFERRLGTPAAGVAKRARSALFFAVSGTGAPDRRLSG
jgi:hypothetical protein